MTGLDVKSHMRLRLAADHAPGHLIRWQLGESEWIMAAHVSRLLDDPAALAAEPVIVNRLRRLRDARRRVRVG